jgi:hypothetical protein
VVGGCANTGTCVRGVAWMGRCGEHEINTGLGIKVKELPDCVHDPDEQALLFKNLLRLCREDEARRFGRSFLRQRIGDDMLGEVSDRLGRALA